MKNLISTILIIFTGLLLSNSLMAQGSSAISAPNVEIGPPLSDSVKAHQKHLNSMSDKYKHKTKKAIECKGTAKKTLEPLSP